MKNGLFDAISDEKTMEKIDMDTGTAYNLPSKPWNQQQTGWPKSIWAILV